MTTYALQNNDIYVVNGQLALVDNQDQVAQDIATRLRTFAGEYFADSTFGLSYTSIWNKPIDTDYFDMLVKNIILGTKGVKQISSYASTIDTRNRKYNIDFSVMALSGDDLELALSLP